MKRLWHHALAHRHHRLDHPGDSRRRLGVADVGLERAEPYRGLALLAVGGEQGPCLDRVPQGGAGAVGLDHVYVCCLQAGVGQCLADHPLLGGAVGGGEAVGGAVLVDGAPPDRGEDVVAVCLGIGEALQDEDADALGDPDPVRRVRERLAATVPSQALLAAEVTEDRGGGEHGRSARQRQIALPLAQRPRRQVHRHQRGGAGGVDRDRRALEAERVGDAAGGGTGRHAGGIVDGDPVVVVHDTGEDAGGRTPQRVGIDARVLQRLPGGFERQPLLGIDRERLARADAEEPRVEIGRVGEEATFPAVVELGPAGVEDVDARRVPAAVGRQLRDRVAPGPDQPPKLGGRGDAAGVAAGHADDRDRLHGGARSRHREPGVTPARDPGEDLPRQRLRIGVIEDHGRRQLQAGGRRQPVAQLDRGQRVEAEVLEGVLGPHRLGRGVTEDRRHLGADEVLGETAPCPLGRLAQVAGESPGRGGARLAADPHHLSEQRRQPSRHRLGPQRRAVEAHRRGQRLLSSERPIEEVEALLLGQRLDAGPAHAGNVRVVEVARHAALAPPQAPGDRGSG